jgi:hypothetical protein
VWFQTFEGKKTVAMNQLFFPTGPLNYLVNRDLSGSIVFQNQITPADDGPSNYPVSNLFEVSGVQPNSFYLFILKMRVDPGVLVENIRIGGQDFPIYLYPSAKEHTFLIHYVPSEDNPTIQIELDKNYIQSTHSLFSTSNPKIYINAVHLFELKKFHAWFKCQTEPTKVFLYRNGGGYGAELNNITLSNWTNMNTYQFEDVNPFHFVNLIYLNFDSLLPSLLVSLKLIPEGQTDAENPSYTSLDKTIILNDTSAGFLLPNANDCFSFFNWVRYYYDNEYIMTYQEHLFSDHHKLTSNPNFSYAGQLEKFKLIMQNYALQRGDSNYYQGNYIGKQSLDGMYDYFRGIGANYTISIPVFQEEDRQNGYDQTIINQLANKKLLHAGTDWSAFYTDLAPIDNKGWATEFHKNEELNDNKDRKFVLFKTPESALNPGFDLQTLTESSNKLFDYVKHLYNPLSTDSLFPFIIRLGELGDTFAGFCYPLHSDQAILDEINRINNTNYLPDERYKNEFINYLNAQINIQANVSNQLNAIDTSISSYKTILNNKPLVVQEVITNNPLPNNGFYDATYYFWDDRDPLNLDTFLPNDTHYTQRRANTTADLWYWQLRYWNYYNVNIVAQFSSLVKNKLPNQNHLIYSDVSKPFTYLLGFEQYELGHQNALDLFQFKDEQSSYYQNAYTNVVYSNFFAEYALALRNASSNNHPPKEIYPYLNADKLDYKVLIWLSRESKFWEAYQWGPEIFFGDDWGGSGVVSTVFSKMLNAATRVIKPAEEHIYDAKKESSGIGFLIPQTAPIWLTDEATNTVGLQDFPFRNGLKEQELDNNTGYYGMLVHAGFSVNLLFEAQIIDQFNTLDTFKVLYINTSHLRDDVFYKLVDWVENKGGLLILAEIKPLFNEYNQEISIREEWFGNANDTTFVKINKGKGGILHVPNAVESIHKLGYQYNNNPISQNYKSYFPLSFNHAIREQFISEISGFSTLLTSSFVFPNLKNVRVEKTINTPLDTNGQDYYVNLIEAVMMQQTTADTGGVVLLNYNNRPYETINGNYVFDDNLNEFYQKEYEVKLIIKKQINNLVFKSSIGTILNVFYNNTLNQYELTILLDKYDIIYWEKDKTIDECYHCNTWFCRFFCRIRIKIKKYFDGPKKPKPGEPVENILRRVVNFIAKILRIIKS